MSTRPVTIALALALVLLAACSSTRKLGPDEYFDEATTAFEKEEYEIAIKSYKEMLDQYPFSEHAEEAELRIAHAHYKNRQYPEAVAAFNDFQRMHPMSAHLPEVYYLLGMSYMDQMRTIDRDQSASENAHGWFRVVLDRYPESSYADKARHEIAVCREALAEHELYITTYYLKRDNVKAGENRVKSIVEIYPDTRAATRALDRLAAAYEKAGEARQAELARAAVAERIAAGIGVPADDDEDEVPPATTTPVAHGPATHALLADLSARYGSGDSAPPSTATAAAPALVDPEGERRPGTTGDPRYGPGPGFEPGAY